MFNSIKKIGLAASVSLIALTGAASASEMVKISDVEVKTTFAQAEDANAENQFPQIRADIAAAIAEKVDINVGGNDGTIVVDIRKLALDGDTLRADSTEFNQLEGVVKIVTGASTPGDYTFPVYITAQTADTTPIDGAIVLSPSTDTFYMAMIDGFAAEVVKGLENVKPEES